jgi:hypothetical protein
MCICSISSFLSCLWVFNILDACSMIRGSSSLSFALSRTRKGLIWTELGFYLDKTVVLLNNGASVFEATASRGATSAIHQGYS